MFLDWPCHLIHREIFWNLKLLFCEKNKTTIRNHFNSRLLFFPLSSWQDLNHANTHEVMCGCMHQKNLMWFVQVVKKKLNMKNTCFYFLVHFSQEAWIRKGFKGVRGGEVTNFYFVWSKRKNKLHHVTSLKKIVRYFKPHDHLLNLMVDLTFYFLFIYLFIEFSVFCRILFE